MFSFFKKKQHNDVPEKLNVINVFNKKQDVIKSQHNKNLQYNHSNKRLQQFSKILDQKIVDIQKLKQLAWNGVPIAHRSKVWKLLLKYMPTNKQNQMQSIARKRKDYHVMVNTYILQPTLQQDAQQKKTSKLIGDDVHRTLPESQLFRHPKIQDMMKRLLYVWHMRHPASGYVQGINDIVTPFIIVYLNQYCEINTQKLDVPKGLTEIEEQNLKNIQADSYWSLSKLLDVILDNYTNSWPGIYKSFSKVQQIFKRVDAQLLQHFKQENIDFYHMYFKWVTCLLLRQFSTQIGLRLFDTYLSDQSNYFNLCLYILAAVILKYSKKFKKMSFQQMMIFQQNMPTREWSEQDLSTVIAQAYVYQSYFIK